MMKVRLKTPGTNVRVSPSAFTRCRSSARPFFASEGERRRSVEGGLVADLSFPLVLGETARRFGRLDEAPRVHQRERRGRSGLREPVSVGPSSIAFLARTPDFGTEDGVIGEIVDLVRA